MTLTATLGYTAALTAGAVSALALTWRSCAPLTWRLSLHSRLLTADRVLVAECPNCGHTFAQRHALTCAPIDRLLAMDADGIADGRAILFGPEPAPGPCTHDLCFCLNTERPDHCECRLAGDPCCCCGRGPRRLSAKPWSK